MKDWERTSWTNGNVTVYIAELIDFLGPSVHQIKISDLPKKLTSTDPHKVNEANLEYPIIVLEHGGIYRYILDGNHRLQKAIDKKNITIKAKILDLDNSETPEKYKKLFR